MDIVVLGYFSQSYHIVTKISISPALLVIVYIHTYMHEVVYLFSQPDDS